MAKTIIIADDHPLILTGLRTQLESLEGYRVLDEAIDGESALRLIRFLKPDIAILDISMPKMNGLEVLQAVFKDRLDTSIIMLSMYKDAKLIEKTQEEGAKGYLLKDTMLEELNICLETVAGGSTYLSQSMLAAAKAELSRHPELAGLSTMERKVFDLIKEARTTKEIARSLKISEKTVDNHRYNIVKKLGLPGGKNAILKYLISNKKDWS
ncbi:MAG: response regulator transcription factor [Bacteroidota bacterium]